MKVLLKDLSIDITSVHPNFITKKGKYGNILSSNELVLEASIPILNEIVKFDRINLYDENVVLSFTCSLDDYSEHEIFEYLNQLVINRNIFIDYDYNNSRYSSRYNPSIDITEEELFYLKLKYPKLIKVKNE